MARVDRAPARHASARHTSVAAGGYSEPGDEAAEYAPQVIEAMVTGRPRVIQVTTANTGLVPNLPAGAPVEVPCVVDGAGARPVYAGELPPQCAALNRAFLGVVGLTVAAGVEERPELVRQALLADPNTAATLSPPRIEELADAMAQAHAALLPPYLARHHHHPLR